MNCHPTLCGVLLEVEENKVVGVRGYPDYPDSRGFLSIRGQAACEVYENPARRLYSLVRDWREYQFRRATLDEALERVTTAITAHPPQATAMWPGQGTFTTNYGTRVRAKLFARFANFHGSQIFNPTTSVDQVAGAFGGVLLDSAISNINNPNDDDIGRAALYDTGSGLDFYYQFCNLAAPLSTYGVARFGLGDFGSLGDTTVNVFQAEPVLA
jgi:hypothetical protein